MADDLATIADRATARKLAIVHIIVGLLLLFCGIADLVIVPYFWMGYVGFGIWSGAWMCITGGLGIPGTRKDPSPSRNRLAGVFMGFSITSAVFGGIIILCYNISIVWYGMVSFGHGLEPHDYDSSMEEYMIHYKLSTEMAISFCILILCIMELVIGSWVATCLSRMNRPQQRNIWSNDHRLPTSTGGAASSL